MRKTHKLLSVLLTVCMLLSLALPLTANAADITFSDVPSTHDYYKAITNLAAEGILNGFEDGSFKPEDPVTRAQFTKIICYAMGVGDLNYGESQRASFPDVVFDHWAIHNITTAYNSKIINGYDDGTFKPENSVLYEQAVKMAVCALGYPEERANRNGGYPNGYIKIASDIKMLKNIIGAKIGTPLTRGGVAQLIDNMMDAEMYKETGTPESSEGNSLRDQVTASKQQLDGRIVAIYGTSIYHDETSECNKKQVELEKANGAREFFGIENLDGFDPNAHLGRSVTVYYEEDNSLDYYEATDIALQKKKNDEITIAIDSVEDLIGNELEYIDEESDDIEEITIDSDICILVNGVAVDDSLQDVLDDAAGKSGYITLVCSQDNDVADVAFVKTYETVIVKSKDAKNYKVYALNQGGASYILDENDRSKSITFTKDGKPASFSSISTSSVLSISTSEDGKLIDVQISTASKKGTITEMLSDGSLRLSNDDTLYRLADDCYKEGEITTGTYLTLFLDAFGKVARYVISAEKSYTFGYLAYAEAGSITDPKVELMVYKLAASSTTPTGTIYALKDTVRIDGKVYSVDKDQDTIITLLEDAAKTSNLNAAINGTDPENTLFAQPIRFTTSSSNEIDNLMTINSSTGEFNMSMHMKYHMDEPILCRTNKTALGPYSISSSVPILLVPSDRLGGTYMTKNNSYFKKDESYYVQLVNVNTANQPQAIYVYGTGQGGSDLTTEVLTEDSIPMMVTDVTDVVYNGESRKSLKLIGVDGATGQVYDDGRKDTEIISTIKPGDIIRIAADAEGMIDAIEFVTSAHAVTDGTQEGFAKSYGTAGGVDELDAPARILLGEVYSVSGSSIALAPSFGAGTSETRETYTYSSDVKIFLIDTETTNENKLVSECDFGEVVGRVQQPDNASKVMIYTVDGKLKAMIVIK